MIAVRPVALGLIAAALAAVLAVVVDVGGPVRALLTVPFLLLGPGLAISLPMGPMAGASRVLVAVAGSVAATTLVSLLLLLTGVWSAGLGVGLLAVIVVSIAVLQLRDPSRLRPDAPNPTSSAADVPASPTRRTSWP